MSESRLPIHPYAELFPQMNSAEFDRLCGDILRNGLQEEIVLHEGQVLEGRHRYLACLARQVPPRFRAYAGYLHDDGFIAALCEVRAIGRLGVEASGW